MNIYTYTKNAYIYIYTYKYSRFMHGIPRKSINDQTLHMFVSLLSWGNQVISDPLMSPSSHLADRSDTYPISFF